MPWITTKSGKRVNTDWFDDDEKKKQSQINANKQEADKKNNKIADYSKFDNQEDMAMELYQRTGINFRGQLKAIDKDTFAETCKTLEDLQQKYRINKVPDPNSLENGRLDIKVPISYENDFKEEGAIKDAFACAELSTITINPKYYSLPPKELNEIYAEGTQGFDNFHPKGTTANDIIVHEAAHTMLDQQVWAMCKNPDGKYDVDKYFKIQKFLLEEQEYSDVGSSALPEIKTLFGKFDKVRKKYIKYLNKDEEAISYIGSNIRDSSMLRDLSNTQRYGRYGISKYSAKNYHELIAEAFADYHANGKNARPLSLMLVKEFFNFE